MKILILGSGLIGPAAAFNAMSDPDVIQVMLCDISREQLDAAEAKLGGMKGADKLTTVVLDINDQAATIRFMTSFDVVLGALPPSLIPNAVRAAVAAGVPFVDLLLPTEPELEDLGRVVQTAEAQVILNCGLEPGLSEIMARYLAEKLERVDELHVQCGGIPEKPAPPLGYKIVFGGRELPLREGDACIVENGEIKPVPRYTGVEMVTFPGIGECEAWLESFAPWLLNLDALKGLKLGTHRTIRWPGYAAKVRVLKEMGFLSQGPIEVDGAQIAPKKYLDTLLYPRVRMEEGERDITVFRVEAIGEKDGCSQRYLIEMVDRYDDELGFTSMARTTGFTGATLARMVARGDIAVKGLYMAEEIITGPLFDKLVNELARFNVRFNLTTETVAPLG